MAKLGDVCIIQSGGTPTRSNPLYWSDGTIPWVKISDMKDKYLNKVEEYISEEGLNHSSAKVFPAGTLLYTIFATLGEVCILDIDAATNQAIAGLQIIDNEVSTDYLYYYLLSLKTKVNHIGRGVAQNNINMKILKDIEIPLPPLDEQRKIAAVLDKVSDLIAKRCQQLEKLDLLVKARFTEMFGDSVLNPFGWQQKYFDEVSILITDGEHSTPKRVKSGIYLLSARNILNHAIRLDDVDYIDENEYNRISKRIVPSEGDVLISCSGSVGRCCVVPSDFKFQMVRSVALIRFCDTVNPIFAEWLILSDNIQNQIGKSATKSSQANLFQGKIRTLYGYFPPIELQNEFADFVTQTEKIKTTIKQSLEKLETLKKSLMQEYFG